MSLKSSKNITTSQQQREIKPILPDLFRDFQKIRGEETGENPTKAPSTFFISLSRFWFSIEEQQEREEVEEQQKVPTTLPREFQEQASSVFLLVFRSGCSSQHNKRRR